MSSDTIDVRAELTGAVWTVDCAIGDRVDEDDELMVLESMKMEIPVLAPCPGTVVAIERAKGDAVAEGDLLLVLSPA